MSQKTTKGKYHDLLKTLVNQPDIIKHIMENDCCSEDDMENMYESIQKELYEFALNMILILEEERMVYRDCHNFEQLHLLITKLRKDIIVLQHHEPLIMLEKNKAEVERILKKYPNGSGMARILGYAYRSDEWWHDNKYNIKYKVSDSAGNKYLIYNFVCPIKDYDKKIQNKIINKRKSFALVLKNYGYKVHIEMEKWKTKKLDCFPL